MTQSILTKQTGHVFEIIISREDKRNAISFAMWQELGDAVSAANKAQGVRAVLLRGTGRGFSAGIDIASFGSLNETYGEHWVQRGRFVTADVQAIVNRLEKLELPTIALLQGFCLGMALELALACDFRIGTADLKLGLPESLLGIIPDVGGTTRLTRLIGPSRAKELIFTGKQIDATTAERYGILSQVVASGELQAAGDAMIAELCKAAPLSIGLAKRIIDGLADNERGFELEGWAQAQLFGTADFAEAQKSFAEKRPPVFKGR